MSTTSLSRRRLLSHAAGAAVIMTAAVACDTSSETTNNGQQNSSVELPKYQPFTKVAPDFPADEQGTMPGYRAYPANPEPFIDGPIASSPIQVLSQADGPIPPTVDRNRFWRDLNERLGAELRLNLAPPADYTQKLATILASGGMPDLTMIRFTDVARLPDMLRAQCADLTEFLSGENAAAYPALANIPGQSWKSTVFNGGIYGVPINRGAIGGLTMIRLDIAEQRGLSAQVTNGKEFIELLKGLSDPQRNRWASAAPEMLLMHFLEMMNGPNVWAEEAGRFSHAYESEQIKQALSVVAGLWKDGVFHPDSFASKKTTNWFSNGTIALYHGGYGGWLSYDKVDDFRIGGVAPVGFDNGGVVKKFTGPGIYSMTVLKKGSKDRTRELLRALNFLAAPIGTTEHLFRNYGIKDYSYTLEGTDPVATDKGKAERLPLSYVGAAPHSLYAPGKADWIEAQHAFQKQVLAATKHNAALGLYSVTASTKQASLDKRITDLQGEIIQGRKTLADWDIEVDYWKRNGGDQMRAEYETAFENT